MTSRRIRLIDPQSRPGRPFNPWITRWPGLGPITLASWLERSGYDVSVYNENLSGPLPENPEAWAEFLEADVIGISIMTPTARRGYELADSLREANPRATLVLGGVHASFMPDEAAQHADVVVRGEAENIIDAIAAGEITSGIHMPGPLEDMDRLPTINHSLLRDFDRLLVGVAGKDNYELPMMTSRGCPYGCTYCSVTRMFGRKVRRQSVEKVHADLRHHAGKGFRRLFFYDDNFTSNRPWTRELLQRMRPMNMRFNAQARVDFHWADRKRTRLDRQLLRDLRRGGGNVLYVGYETISEETANRWKKGYSGENPLPKRLAEDTRILHDAGLWVHGMFVFGPEHTRRDAQNIVEFCRSNEIESIQISILTPLPGTSMMNEFGQHLVFDRFPQDWDYFDGSHCVYNHGQMGVEETQQAILDAHKSFYRWGGLSVRRLRGLLEGQGGSMNKLRHFWVNATRARSTLTAWQRETAEFLASARERLMDVGRLPLLAGTDHAENVPIPIGAD